MTDPSSVLNALQALKVATDIVRGLRAANASFEKAELKLKVAEVAEALADARTSVLDAQEEIRQLRAEIDKLKVAKVDRDRLVMREGVYFLKGVRGAKAGPFCVRCFESDQNLMPVRKLHPEFAEFGKHKCPECQAVY